MIIKDKKKKHDEHTISRKINRVALIGSWVVKHIQNTNVKRDKESTKMTDENSKDRIGVQISSAVSKYRSETRQITRNNSQSPC